MKVPLSKATIDRCFEGCKHQADVVLKLYNAVVPEYDKVKKMTTYPAVSNTTSTYIFEKFFVFDKEHHPECIRGGLWLNKGFSTKDEISDWTCKVDMRGVRYV